MSCWLPRVVDTQSLVLTTVGMSWDKKSRRRTGQDPHEQCHQWHDQLISDDDKQRGLTGHRCYAPEFRTVLCAVMRPRRQFHIETA